MNEHRNRFGFAYEVCPRSCFSLGVHIDIPNHYIDLHIWNWFIHIGNEEASNIPKELMKEVYVLQDKCHDEVDKILDKYHALKI